MLIRPACSGDAAEIEALLDAAFGPGRHARTASRLRTGARPLAGPSLVARGEQDELLGSVQLWPIALVTGTEPHDGQQARQVSLLTLLGPVAVAARARSIGLGRRLISASLAIADDAGIDPILLIGDESYYGRFGFTASATYGWSLPGPVERPRLLLRQHTPKPLPRFAALGPLPAAPLAGAGLDCIAA